MDSMNIHAYEMANDNEGHYADTVKRIESGRIVRGKVVSQKSDSIIVDVGYKSEGIIPIAEFSSDEISRLKEGDLIEVFVERVNEKEEVITLSRDKARKIIAMRSLIEFYQKKIPVEGKVIEKTKGGLYVDINGIKAFLPASHIDIKKPKDIEQYIGQSIPLRIISISQKSSNLTASFEQISKITPIVSRRVILEEERRIKKERTLKLLKEGNLIKGIVKNITDYGVFVDLGGIDGLLHISDISWRRVGHPSEFFSIGDEREFIVLKYDEASEKVCLGYKQKKPDPWLTVEERYSTGLKIKGKVVNITDYGIFVEIEDGLEGLIHFTELDWTNRPKHPSKYASIGDEIEALIINLNKNERKLSLSLKQLKPKPWDLVGQNYKLGQRVYGRIKTLTDFGAFIRLPEGVDGLIHISDISWTKHIKHPSEVLKKGQKVEAVVLSLEPEKERISLGIKQLVPDPWINDIPVKYRLGMEFTGKVVSITDFGIFVEINNEVEGLVYSSEIDTSKEIKKGDEIIVKIIKVNIEDRKIGLSMKNLSRDGYEN